MKTYTLAQITAYGPRAIAGIPCNMTKAQAETMASKAIANGFANVVAYNTESL